MYFCNTSFLLPIKFCPIMNKTLLFKTVSKIVKLSAVLLLLFTIQTDSKAQSVDYAIKWGHAYDLGDTLTVYMKSSTTINFPFNQVSTSQVTLRVPSGMLPYFRGDGSQTTTVADTLLQGTGRGLASDNNGSWSNNARFNFGDPTNNTTHYPGGTLTAHQDGNEYDYISFGLTDLGTRNIEFVAGEELPLFSFIFPQGDSCVADIPIQVLHHVIDSSFMENGVTSPNNNMSVLGPGGDIYSGNYFDEYGARCYDFDNDDVNNTDDRCDYSLIVDIENNIVDANGCTDYDGDGFYPDDNPTPDDQDSPTSPFPDTLPGEVETYNIYDTDILNQCVPQGDSMRATLTVNTTDICAGDPVSVTISVIETESNSDANTPGSPFDYDDRGRYNVTITGSLSGDRTFPNLPADTTFDIFTSEDGDAFSMVEVLDTFLCSAVELNGSGSVNVNEGVTLATIDGDEALCGTGPVDIVFEFVGGTAPFDVVWSGGSFTTSNNPHTITINPVASVEHTLTSVTDAGGCSTPVDALIGAATIDFADEIPLVLGDVTLTQPSDCGLSDGSILIDSTGFGPNVEFSRNGGATWQASPSFTGLGTGNYVVAARKDGNDNCIATVDSIFSLAASEAPVFASVSEDQPTDCSANTGSIEVLMQTVGANTVEYELRQGASVIQAWAVGNQTNSQHIFTGVADGTYQIYVRYNNGSPSCQVQFPGGAEINGISAPTTNTPVVNSATDCTETDGDISIAASSSDGFALEYRLINVDESDTSAWGSQNVFVGLSPDSFHIQVRNAGTTNCIQSVTGLQITRPDSITLNPAANTDIERCGEETGQIVLSGTSSGSSTLEYSINGGATWQSSPTFNDLAPGTYTAAIRNQLDQSCESPYSSAIEITRPEDIVMINPIKTDETDCSAGDGTVLAQIASSDGDSTLTFEVNGVIQVGSPSFSGLSQGTYNVKAYYADGVSCRDSIDVTIDGRNAITATAVGTDSPVCGEDQGEIQIINLTAADGAVEYSIDGGTTWQPSNVFNDNLGSATYTPEVRYADNTCLVAINSVTLTLPDPTVIVDLDVTASDASQCGVDDAKILIDTSSFGGSNHEFSIDGVTFQQADSFVNLTGGTYIITVRNAGVNSCFDTTSVTIANNDAPQLNARVYLQGAFNTSTGIMNDDLREKGLIPSSSPYGSTNLTTLGVYTGGETSNGATPHHTDIQLINDPDAGNDHAGATLTAPQFAEVTQDRAANSVVDWILVELRPSQDSAFVRSRSVGMVQRDGDIVTWKDGVTDMLFRGVCASDTTSYYVSIKHRNHAGVMTLDPVDFSSGLVNLDFTSTDLQLYTLPGLAIPQEPSAVLPNGKRALWGGNVGFNRRVLFQGTATDPELISDVVLGHPDNDDPSEQLRNFIANGYYNSDVNMDGVTIFQGAPNDVDIIFFNIMANPDNTQFNRNFALREQLPGND